MYRPRYLFFLLDIFLIGVSVFLSVVSYIFYDIYWALLSAIICLLSNILYATRNLSERLLFLFFCFFVFLFLLSRPSIAYLYDIVWWEIDYHATFIALFLIFLSLLGIRLGYSIFGSNKINLKRIVSISKCNNCFLFFLFFIFSLLKFYSEYEKYTKYSNLLYTDLYMPKDSIGIMEVLSGFYVYIFIIFLATFPKQKLVFFSFFLYVLAILPSLLLGERVNMGITMVFFLLYYILRYNFVKKNYFSFSFKKLIILSVTFSFLVILFSEVQNHREKSHSSHSQMNTLSNFMYLQGTSFDTLIQGVYFEEEIKKQNLDYISYTFGPIIDQLRFNKIAQILFNAQGLESGNSLSTVQRSNNLAHSLSYVVLEGSYLNGHGRGSSYILETYLDFKYPGVILFSILLGFILNRVWNMVYLSSFIYRCIALVMIMNIVLLPRINYIFFISFIFDIKFWLCVFVGYLSLKGRKLE